MKIWITQPTDITSIWITFSLVFQPLATIDGNKTSSRGKIEIPSYICEWLCWPSVSAINRLRSEMDKIIEIFYYFPPWFRWSEKEEFPIILHKRIFMNYFTLSSSAFSPNWKYIIPLGFICIFIFLQIDIFHPFSDFIHWRFLN